jgi:hypothetical protein
MFRPPRILDASAIVALFRGHRTLDLMFTGAEGGEFQLLLPTTAVADAEADIRARTSGWEAILLTRGVRSLPLSEHTAIDVGTWPGTLSARHVAHEALAIRATVVTLQPESFSGMAVPLMVV